MRYLLTLIALGAIAACIDAPVEPNRHATGGALTASLEIGTTTTSTVAGDTTSASATSSVTVTDTTSPGSTSAGTSTTATDTTATPTSAGAEPASSLQPLYCPSSNEVRSVRGWIGPQGGELDFRGHALNLPPGAVTEPTQFEIVVPISDFMEIDVHAVGTDSFLFQVPATITISFQRCSSLPTTALTAAWVDQTNQILENMNGAVDVRNRKVSFRTGHLSGYMVAY